MNYRHIYMLIIKHAKKETFLGLRPKNKNQKKNFPNQYFEFHHILPRSLFPCWVKRKSNIVALTAREHFFCHQLLTKIWPSSTTYAALAIFARHSKGQIRQLTPKQYEQCRQAYSKMNKGKIPWNKGIPRSESVKQKLKVPRPTCLGELNPAKRPEIRQKISETKLGIKNPNAKHWIIKNKETGEIWDFYGGLKSWAIKQGFKYIGSLTKNEHKKYEVLLSESIKDRHAS